MGIRIGVIGCGHWGPNHIRNFSSAAHSQVVAAADPKDDRRESLKRLYPAVMFYADHRELLASGEVDAVVIAAPTRFHFELTREALLAGKDVLCEKPLATRSSECHELGKIAQDQRRILMIGHVFLYNAGIQKLADLLRNGEAGRIYYAHATRTNLGPIREDVNVAWDLASHDISIFNYLLGAAPLSVTAIGGRYLQRDQEDVSFISAKYPRGILANIHVSWMDPKKIREITIVGDKKMLVWNDLHPEGPVRIYDKGVIQEPYYETFGEFHLLVREGDLTVPRIRVGEPLKVQADQFIQSVRQRTTPTCDVRLATQVVETLEAVDRSMQEGGRPVTIGAIPPVRTKKG